MIFSTKVIRALRPHLVHDVVLARSFDPINSLSLGAAFRKRHRFAYDHIGSDRRVPGSERTGLWTGHALSFRVTVLLAFQGWATYFGPLFSPPSALGSFYGKQIDIAPRSRRMMKDESVAALSFVWTGRSDVRDKARGRNEGPP